MVNASVENRQKWSAPKLEELGNLRSLVKVGGANGKSGRTMDGGANAGCEVMDMIGGCGG